MVFREDPKTGNVRDDGSTGDDKYAPKKDFGNVGGLADRARQLAKKPTAKKPMPKSTDYKDSKAYMAAMRKHRAELDNDSDTTAQKNFLKK